VLYPCGAPSWWALMWARDGTEDAEREQDSTARPDTSSDFSAGLGVRGEGCLEGGEGRGRGPVQRTEVGGQTSVISSRSHALPG